MQSGINFLEGDVASGDIWKEKQRIIVDDDSKQAKNQQNQNQNLDLVIKVSVPDWKVMAFSSESDGQLVWERQVRTLKHHSHSDECSCVLETNVTHPLDSSSAHPSLRPGWWAEVK